VRELRLYVGGEERDGAGTEEVFSPWGDEVVGRVHVADEGLVDEAIAAGADATAAMAALPAWERRALLQRIADAVEDEVESLSTTISAESGKPITFARGEVLRCAQTFRFAAEEAWRLADESVDLAAAPTGAGRFGVVRRFPVGLVAGIAPFNFPLNLVAHKIAPAFAAGCPIVLKPAEQTPMTALLLARICHDAGIPAGGLNVVPAARAFADALVTDERIKLLSFTGSPGVGWDMKARAGRKKVVLELGGNAAVIVNHDADLEAAARRTAFGAFVYAGQVCISVQRVLVHRAVFDAFAEKLEAATRSLVVGDPRREETIAGPLIDARAAARVVEWIEEARQGGARVRCGGERDGNVITPTLLEDVPPDARLARQEVFGPVALLAPFADIDDAIAQVNDSPFGLQVGVFTDSVRDVWRCYEGCEVGGVIHNDFPTWRVDHMPYGGVKDSGFGREGLRYAMDDYTERRLLALRPEGIPT
jgi:glyceraldehyde-3-phosphate dehydrogenase (NADP+)